MPIPSVNNTQEYLNNLHNTLTLTRNGVDAIWISSNTYLIFFMMFGFAFLEIGCTRNKNITSTLVKNILDRLIASLAWWLIGYGFAFGESKSGVIGTSYFAGVGLETFTQYTNWMFQWAFAGTSAIIVSGCVLERITLWGYALFSGFMTIWVYPLIVHWFWNEKGWLNGLGIHDFAGSGVVHMVGGVAGLTATIFIGARIGRFPAKNEKEDKKRVNKEFLSNSPLFVSLGTMSLWFCWYGFNCGSTVIIVGEHATILVGKIGLNTTLSASSAGLTYFLFVYFLKRGTDSEYSIIALCNGILGGLVGITASCDSVESWCAMFIGVMSGFVCIGYTKLLEKLKVDDPLDAVPVHMGCGSWGLIAYGWFDPRTGVLYGKGGRQFGVQLLGVIIIFLWVSCSTLLIFLFLKLSKLHRISAEEEKMGQDMKCGGVIHQMDHIFLADYAMNIVESVRNDTTTKEEKIYKSVENKNPINEKSEVEMEIRNL